MSNRHFPKIGNKLSAPAKKSQFERQKAEAEAKRLREEAENAAALAEFEQDFGGGSDDDDPAPKTEASSSDVPYMRGLGAFAGGGPPKRHFTGAMKNSGPGSLGPTPQLLSRKRAHDGSSWEREQGIFGYNKSSSRHDVAAEFQESDEEDMDTAMKDAEPDMPRPTLYLSNLPPTISQPMIRELIPTNLKAGQITFVPVPNDPNTGERLSKAATVTLDKGIPLSEIDAVAMALDKKYMGYGYYLSITRQISATLPVMSGQRDNNPLYNPFGARPVQNVSRNAPPRGGFAPPGSYAPSGPGRSGGPLEVKVTPPADLQQIKLIHHTIENVVKHGPEFEALLMSRPEVQKEEKWAWIWNPKSVGGIWYRWRLWEMLTQESRSVAERTFLRASYQPIFDDGPLWAAPEDVPKFEFQTELNEFVDDSDYVSSDMDDSGDENPRRQFNTGAPPPEGGLGDPTKERAYLNPLEKAQLTWLLARLPTTNAKLRKGDVARITNFAITHGSRGWEEVVEMIVMNVEKPFAFTSAGNGRSEEPEEGSDDKTAGKLEKEDPSSAKLVALYVIHDIIMAAPTSGLSGSWRYRQNFEEALKQRKVFQHLGRLDRDLQWGKLKAEKWKRSVNMLLSMWGQTFAKDSIRLFTDSFMNPPLTAAEKELAAKEAEEKAKAKAAGSVKIKLRKADENESASASPALAPSSVSPGNIQGEPMDEDVVAAPIDGARPEPMETDSAVPSLELKAVGGSSEMSAGKMAPAGQKREPEDMFADSDDE